MTQTLEQLSAAFTRLEGWPSALRETSLNNVGPLASDIATIIEAYRHGQLVSVSDDAIERVARAILKAHVFDTTGFTEDAANAIADHAVQAWIPEAKAAIAAMKDTQPNLAAKGTGDE